MSLAQLQTVANALVAEGKGILAADESNNTAGKRLASIDMENTEENRQQMRNMFFTSEGIENYISGVILYEETLNQKADDGRSFPGMLADKGIVSGIKVDLGLEPIKDGSIEMVTKGLDGLEERLLDYYEKGARFAKWRATFTITDETPTDDAYVENAERLAEYARLCQECNIVPIVEPEVLMDGEHSGHDIERAFAVVKDAHKTLFRKLEEKEVDLSGILLKPSMVIAGKTAEAQVSVEDVATKTLECLKMTVPGKVPGIVFLSGGQTDEQATAHLNEMNKQEGGKSPWKLSFSYGRALQGSALEAWKEGGVEAGQAKFIERADACKKAALGTL